MKLINFSCKQAIPHCKAKIIKTESLTNGDILYIWARIVNIYVFLLYKCLPVKIVIISYILNTFKEKVTERVLFFSLFM
jgi:hypothetical protein